jgi:muconolactone delta-isomerase
MDTLTMLERFKANEQARPLPLQQERDCNGYWRQIPGMSWRSEPRCTVRRG